jgi:CRP/FNR family transcriptional regulator, cyclic AMP receptor protein
LDASALRSCMLFSGLTDEERAARVARAPTRTFGPGETVFLMGSQGDSMMAVLSGSVRISVSSPDGKELTLAIVEKDEIFGEIALLDRKERTADATAMTTCKLAILDRREIQLFLEAHPAALLRVVDMLCARLRRTDQQLAELALLPVPVRLAKALLRLATSEGQPVNGRPVERVHLTQRELGNVIGATRESVNKHLRAWQRRGCVRIGDRLIVITDRARLEHLAGSED